MPIGINGTGSITGISAGGLPDATITQAELATPVGGTGPAFMAIQNGVDQNVTSSVTTKVTLGNELFDTNSNFSSSTFTPTVSGYYQISGIVRGTSGSTNVTSVVAIINKNGSIYSQSFSVSAGVASIQVPISALVYMNGTTDYIELHGSVTGTSPFFDYVSDGSCCQLSACLVRAA